MNWYAKSTSGGQGLVIDEADGRNVAVAYDEKDAGLLAAAPDMRTALSTAAESLLAIKECLRLFGEKDSTGTLPLEYVCCPDGVDNIGERINRTMKAIARGQTSSEAR